MSYEGAMDFSDGSTATTEYTWDKNGNMTRDLNRKISKIQYNSLNLPETITYTDGHKVMNTYDCLGRKVSVIYQVSVPSVTTPQADGSSVTSYSYRTYMRRSYSGNCIYRNDTLERILTTTGYITPEGEYHHYLKDYQGNNRMVLNESGQTIERTNYYPYGMPFSDSEHRQPYKYSGKELETMNGLRHLDYGARWMDYPIGRFTTIDRYCEKYYNLSPYAYCANNPILYIDPTGMFSIEVRASYNMNSGIIGVFSTQLESGFMYSPFGGVVRSNSIYGSYDSERDDAIVVGLEHSVEFLDKNSVKVEIPFLNVESFDKKEDIIGVNTEEGEYESKDKDDKIEENLSIGANPIYINTESGEVSIDIGNMLGVLLLGFGADFSITINF